MQTPVRKRCAIYTRKSVEEGLEQEFNSLDAQRASCEAYIQSRKLEGWTLVPDHYDDGGFSGGNLERPAFQRLMHDVEQGRVDMIVCYKLDRLSRKLTDFTDVFKRLESCGAEFTCVTQQVDTSTSTGRMMINILMSFAQYEREMTADRIRDKVRATRRRGMWSGGVIPYGYRVVDKRLVVDPETAGIVSRIFKMFVETGSPKRIVRQLRAEGVFRYPERGVPWRIQTVRYLLRNVIYHGMINAPEGAVAGVHEALVSDELWNKAQEIIRRNSSEPQSERRRSTNALLNGIIRCGTCGSCMSYSWTNKSATGARYGYYIDIRDKKRAMDECPVRRVSAHAVEPAVEREVYRYISTGTFRSLVAEKMRVPFSSVTAGLEGQERFWKAITPVEKRHLFRTLIDSVLVMPDALKIRFNAGGNEQLIQEMTNDQDNN